MLTRPYADQTSLSFASTIERWTLARDGYVSAVNGVRKHSPAEDVGGR